MEEGNHDAPESARKLQSKVFQRLSSVGQAHVAKALSVSEATISRMKGDEIPRMCELLAALGLKLVDEGAVYYPPEHIEHVTYFARIGVAHAAEALPPEVEE